MANKTKRAMSRDLKDKARARKEPATTARKAARRRIQDAAASLNRARGSKPWDAVKLARRKERAARRAVQHGVSGAA